MKEKISLSILRRGVVSLSAADHMNLDADWLMPQLWYGNHVGNAVTGVLLL